VLGTAAGGSLHRETHYRVAGGLRLVESVLPRLVAETFALRGLRRPVTARRQRDLAGKFVHGIYRYVALVRYARERHALTQGS
jgi:hypothetical protein